MINKIFKQIQCRISGCPISDIGMFYKYDEIIYSVARTFCSRCGRKFVMPGIPFIGWIHRVKRVLKFYFVNLREEPHFDTYVPKGLFNK